MQYKVKVALAELLFDPRFLRVEEVLHPFHLCAANAKNNHESLTLDNQGATTVLVQAFEELADVRVGPTTCDMLPTSAGSNKPSRDFLDGNDR